MQFAKGEWCPSEAARNLLLSRFGVRLQANRNAQIAVTAAVDALRNPD